MCGILCGMMEIFVYSYLPLRTGYYLIQRLTCPASEDSARLSAEFVHDMGFSVYHRYTGRFTKFPGTLPNPGMLVSARPSEIRPANRPFHTHPCAIVWGPSSVIGQKRSSAQTRMAAMQLAVAWDPWPD